MPSDEQLLAWVELRGGDYIASFVAESTAKQRAPAMRLFNSQDEARQWVMREADAVRASIKWINDGTVYGCAQH